MDFSYADAERGGDPVSLRKWERSFIEELERRIDVESAPGLWLRTLGFAYLRRRQEVLTRLVRNGGVWSGSASRAVLAVGVRPGDLALDVGANLGRVSQEAAWRVGSTGAVWSFEPSPTIAARLRRRMSRLGLHWVKVVQCAIGSEHGVAVLHEYDWRDGGASSLQPQPHVGQQARSSAEVQVSTLDEYATSFSSSSLAVVKIDVEGAEVEVLRGARALLSQYARPVLVVEASPLTQAAFGRDVGVLLGQIAEYGYSSFLWTRAGMIPISRAEEFPAGRRREDLIALDLKVHGDVHEALGRVARAARGRS